MQMKLSISWFLVLSLALAALVAGACGSDDEGDDDRIKVVTSTAILADIVSNVGGDDIDVQSIVPSGADPHTFTLTPGDIRDVAQADVVVLVGANFSAAEDDIAQNARGRGVVDRQRRGVP